MHIIGLALFGLLKVLRLSLSADWPAPIIPLIMNSDGRLFCLLHSNSPSPIDTNPTNPGLGDKGKVDKRDKKRKEIGEHRDPVPK